MSIETEITRIKSNISNAYLKAEEKGATLPKIQNSDNLASTIESIASGSSEEWQPQTDWWDIDKILEEDTEEYPAKMICLLRDNEDITMIERFGASKILTSDNTEYRTTETKYSHNWNISYDKECSLGYKTRYIIWYFPNKNFDAYNKYVPNSTLYVIMKNFTVTSSFNSLCNKRLCESIKCINTVFKGTYLFFNSNFNMEKITGINVTGDTNFEGSGTGTFQACYKLKTLELQADYEKKYSLWNTFNQCYMLNNIDLEKFGINSELVKAYRYSFPANIKYIKEINFNSIVTSSTDNWKYAFSGLVSLVEIGKIGTITLSGFNFSSCILLNHDTLIRILNALYDYSDSTDTYTITLGATNLAKLTEEELAIGTNKNWTIS